MSIKNFLKFIHVYLIAAKGLNCVQRYIPRFDLAHVEFTQAHLALVGAAVDVMFNSFFVS